jgi:cephalosporin-C deacetylase
MSSAIPRSVFRIASMPFNDLVHPALGAYQSQVETPADFGSFWAETLGEARAAGGAVQIVPVATSLKLVEAFDVTFPGFGGQPVRGWLVLPTHRPERLPLVVQYLGYGGGRGFPHELLHWAASGYAYFRMDTRGQGSGWSMGGTADPVGTTPSIPGMMTKGILDKNDYYYRRVFTDAVRAIDMLVAQDFVDSPTAVKERVDALKSEGRRNAHMMIADPTGALRFVAVPIE